VGLCLCEANPHRQRRGYRNLQLSDELLTPSLHQGQG
jgi:hypothetical protein